jgi:anti-sigma factor RsiW
MYVNRQNYEEFFLLYADHELSAQEREMVDSFLQENPDLKEELQLLFQLRVKPEAGILFEPKASLYRHSVPSDSVISNDSMHLLLLYVDGELDQENKAAVEKMVAQNDVLRQELMLLEQTRVEPDLDMAFPGKDMLYKRASNTPPRLVWWLRVAAAAAVLLAASWLMLSRTTSQRQPANRLSQDLIASPSTRTSPAKKSLDPVTSGSVAALHKAMDKQAVNMKMRTGQPGSSRSQLGRPQVTKQTGVAFTDEPAEAGLTPIRVVQIRLPRVAQPLDKSSGEYASSLGAGTQAVLLESTPLAQVVAKNQRSPKIEAPAMEEFTQNKEDNINFIVFSTNKNSMRGLVRKVSRVFDKMTNADDENKRGLVVGNFQIPLK